MNYLTIKEFLGNIKRLIPSLTGKNLTVTQTETAEDLMFQALVWYGGDPEELSQLYRGNNWAMKFWGCSPSAGRIRRIHSGIPRAMADKMAQIVANGYNHITMDDPNWEGMVKEFLQYGRFEDRLETCVRDTLLYGYGVWKIYFNNGYPEFKWYTYPDVVVDAENDKITFKTSIKDGKYVVHEIYQPGSITVELFTREGIRVHPIAYPAEFLPYLENACSWAGDFSLAVPVVLGASVRFPGKPEGIFSGKFEAFDFLDETLSQLVQHMRAARIMTFVPDTMLLPGQTANSFDFDFIKILASSKQTAEDKIERFSEQIQYEAYHNAYLMALDVACQGIISPCTLGIDTSKTENAEAQREKEKTTIYTRNKLISIFSGSIQQLCRVLLSAYYTAINHYTPAHATAPVSVDFDEYIIPSFDSIVQTVSRAAGLMSIEAKVEELWGNSKSEEWKAEEVERLKIEQGLFQAEEIEAIDYDE